MGVADKVGLGLRVRHIIESLPLMTRSKSGYCCRWARISRPQCGDGLPASPHERPQHGRPADHIRIMISARRR